MHNKRRGKDGLEVVWNFERYEVKGGRNHREGVTVEIEKKIKVEIKKLILQNTSK